MLYDEAAQLSVKPGFDWKAPFRLTLSYLLEHDKIGQGIPLAG